MHICLNYTENGKHIKILLQLVKFLLFFFYRNTSHNYYLRILIIIKPILLQPNHIQTFVTYTFFYNVIFLKYKVLIVVIRQTPIFFTFFIHLSITLFVMNRLSHKVFMILLVNLCKELNNIIILFYQKLLTNRQCYKRITCT